MPFGRGYGSGFAGRRRHVASIARDTQRGEKMPQYRYNGYTISISAMSAGDAIKVDTKILLRPDAVPGVTNKLRASTLRLVPAAPPEDLLKEALETAKHTADVLAQQALGLKRRFSTRFNRPRAIAARPPEGSCRARRTGKRCARFPWRSTSRRRRT